MLHVQQTKQAVEINARINSITADKIALSQEITTEISEVETSKNSYQQALSPIVASINADITKLKTYFPE